MIIYLIFQNSLNFTYTLIKPSDGQWGILKNGKWTGMIGALQHKEVDIGNHLYSISKNALSQVVIRFNIYIYVSL